MSLEPVGMTYEDAIGHAIATSLKHPNCVQHVYAIVRHDPANRRAVVVGYAVSDWCDPSTIVSFVNGRES